MHIKKLRITNFKSHIDSTLEFDQITSIVGTNASGKSNILRALKLILHNGDWPITWIRKGQTSAKIELELVDGTIVTRRRSTTNQSVTITRGGKTEVYEGKKDAKEFIEKALGIKKITLDETTGPEDLNFVDVREEPYLIGGRSDTVQRKIAGMMGANSIDDARVRIAKDLRKKAIILEEKDNYIKGLEPIVSNGSVWLDKAKNLLDTCEDVHKNRANAEREFQEVENLINHINSFVLMDIVGLKKFYEEIVKQTVALKSSYDLATTVEDLIFKWRSLDIDMAAIDVAKLKLERETIQVQLQLKRYILMEEFISISKELAELVVQEQEAQREWETCVKAQKDLLSSGPCPLCGR